MPGAVNAWETLLKAHGRKGLDELLQPAIRFAEEGWPVHPKVSWDWNAAARASCARTARFHVLPGGSAPSAGDLFVKPALAETLRAIARHGARAFYEGPIAADIVATLRKHGGLHTEEDFARGLAQRGIRRADHAEWNGYDVYQFPPNGAGPAGADDARHAGGSGDRARRRVGRDPGCTGISRPRGWPIATATPSSPTRRRWTFRSRNC